MRDTALHGVHRGTTEILRADILAGHRLDDLRPRDEHVRGLLGHEDEIGQGRGVDGASRAGTHDRRDLRNHARGERVAIENVAVTCQGVDALLDTGPARILDADHGHADLHRHVHGLADFRRVHLAERAAYDREVLGEDKNPAALDRSIARHDTLARGLDLVHTEFVAAMLDKGVEFDKTARIEQCGDALARGGLSLFMLGGHTLGPPALYDCCASFLKFSDLLFHSRKPPLQKVHFCQDYAIRIYISARSRLQLSEVPRSVV
jgi:hypothetical protein